MPTELQTLDSSAAQTDLDSDTEGVHPHPAVNPSDLPVLDINLDLIDLDVEFRLRETPDGDVVEEYAELMRDGVWFPPVNLVRDGNRDRLIDGALRCRARQHTCLTTITAVVHEIAADQALVMALRSNLLHGRKLTGSELRERLRRLLMHRQWLSSSDREIARAIGDTRRTVCDHRRHLTEEGDNLTGRQDSQDRRVVRGGTSYKMRVKNIGGGTKAEPSATKRDTQTTGK